MHKKISWWNVNIRPEAEEAVARAVRNRNLSMGKLVADFENRLSDILGVPHVIAVTSGTSALMLALLEAGISPGDEVIVPDWTWIATAHAAHLLGATVVLVDVESGRPLMDPEAFEQAITPRTKAVVPVHLNGRACQMPRIREIAERHGIIVIEDACQALLAASPEGGYLGTHSHAGCFSLSVAKLITSGQGGFIITHENEVANRLRLMRTHGTSDILHPSWLMVGGNFRFTDLQAAIALAQLDYHQELCDCILKCYNKYATCLPISHKKLNFLTSNIKNGELPLYVECMAEDRKAFMQLLAEHNIETRPMYPELRLAPQFSHNADRHFPHARKYAERGVFLPCGPHQSEEDIDTVISVITREYLS